MKTIRTFSIFLVMFIMGIESFASSSSPRFGIQHGLNFANWFCQGKDSVAWLGNYVTKSRIDSLVSMGFDHVRIPVDESYLFDSSLKLRKDRWKVLNSRINYCIQKDLKVIFDLHISRVHTFPKENEPLFTDTKSEDYFMKVWSKLQVLLSTYPTDMLAYECLNEPAGPIKNHQRWNEILNRWITLMHKKEPKRFLFCGFDRGNQLWTADYLELPSNDPYLVITFHYYAPHILTHYKATWHSTYSKYTGGVTYPGIPLSQEDYNQAPSEIQSSLKTYTTTSYNKDKFISDFQKAVKVAHKYNLQLNCGEFGCTVNAPRAMRLAWLNDMTSAMKELDISYTLFGYWNVGFGFLDYKKNIDHELINNLNLEQ